MTVEYSHEHPESHSSLAVDPGQVLQYGGSSRQPFAREGQKAELPGQRWSRGRLAELAFLQGGHTRHHQPEPEGQQGVGRDRLFSSSQRSFIPESRNFGINHL